MADDCSKSEIPSYRQRLPVVGCCWLTIWDSSKHMKIGSYISHRQMRWNLLLIMPLIRELYRAHTVTVFQTDAGKNQTVKVNVCPAGPASISKCTSTGEQTLGGKRWATGGGQQQHMKISTHAIELSRSESHIPLLLKRWQNRQKWTSWILDSHMLGVCGSNGTSLPY